MITLGFQATTSVIVFLNILRENSIINWIIQIISIFATEPILFLIYGTNIPTLIRNLLRKRPNIHAIHQEPIIHSHSKSKIIISVSNTQHELGTEHVDGDTGHNDHGQPDSTINEAKKLLLLTLRCVGIGRNVGLVIAVIVYILYTNHVFANFGLVAQEIFFRDFNTYSDISSVMGAKYYINSISYAHNSHILYFTLEYVLS